MNNVLGDGAVSILLSYFVHIEIYKFSNVVTSIFESLNYGVHN